MEFSIAKNILSDALSIVSSVVPERSARTDLQNLLLIGNADNTITLGATDLEIGVKITIAVNEMKNPSTILLPASRLSALIKGLSEDIHFTIADGKAEIKTTQDKFDLAGSDSEGYPAIPEFKGEGTVFIHGDDFIEAVQKTIFATAKGDTRYSLNGIYVDIDGTKVDFVASDTHRLALVKKKLKNPDNVVCSGIVQTKGMVTLSRLAAGQDLIELKLTQNEMLAKTTSAVVYIRLVDGFFPGTRKSSPKRASPGLRSTGRKWSGGCTMSA
jgi:DNA polymerase-3 subunit beta